jgi:hypothetical protein
MYIRHNFCTPLFMEFNVFHFLPFATGSSAPENIGKFLSSSSCYTISAIILGGIIFMNIESLLKLKITDKVSHSSKN